MSAPPPDAGTPSGKPPDQGGEQPPSNLPGEQPPLNRPSSSPPPPPTEPHAEAIPAAVSDAPGGTPHRWLVRSLIGLATVLGVVAIFAVWANRQLLDTGYWTDTSSKLVESPPIRDALSGYLTD